MHGGIHDERRAAVLTEASLAESCRKNISPVLMTEKSFLKF